MSAVSLSGHLPVTIPDLDREALSTTGLPGWFDVVDDLVPDMTNDHEGHFTGALVFGRRSRSVQGTIRVGRSGRTIRLRGESGYRGFEARLAGARWNDGCRFSLRLDIDGVGKRRLRRAATSAYGRLLSNLSLPGATVRVPSRFRPRRELDIEAVPTGRLRPVNERSVADGQLSHVA